jgi:hypothetical protein
MATQTIRITRPVFHPVSLPQLYLSIPRKDLWLSALILIIGLAIPALMFFEVLPATLFLGLVGFGLSFTGGMLLLVRCGEIA